MKQIHLTSIKAIFTDSQFMDLSGAPEFERWVIKYSFKHKGHQMKGKYLTDNESLDINEVLKHLQDIHQ